MKKIILIFFLIVLALFSLSITITSAAFALTSAKPGLEYPYFLKRNPFQTFLYVKKPAVSFKTEEMPLLRYNLSSLKIIGIMEGRGKYFAMLQTPDGRSYVITVGSVVGIDKARVTSINDDGVTLTQNTHNALGQMRAVSVTMKMRKLK